MIYAHAGKEEFPNTYILVSIKNNSCFSTLLTKKKKFKRNFSSNLKLTVMNTHNKYINKVNVESRKFTNKLISKK